MFTSSDRAALNALKSTVPSLATTIKTVSSTASSAATTANTAMTGVRNVNSTLGSQIKTVRSDTQALRSETQKLSQEVRQRAEEAHELARQATDMARSAESKGPDPQTTSLISGLQNELNVLKKSMLVQTCSELGTQDGDMRLYTAEECDAMNGAYHANGECNNKIDGRSFSVDCGQLYKGQPVTKKAINQKMINLSAAAKNAAATTAAKIAANAAMRNAAARKTKSAALGRVPMAQPGYGEPIPLMPKGVTPIRKGATTKRASWFPPEQVIERKPEGEFIQPQAGIIKEPLMEIPRRQEKVFPSPEESTMKGMINMSAASGALRNSIMQKMSYPMSPTGPMEESIMQKAVETRPVFPSFFGGRRSRTTSRRKRSKRKLSRRRK